jgi:hypothetical protein
MPQGRIILKQICQSRKLSALKTDGARLLYTWLIPNVDVNGCFSGDPDVIKGQIFTRLHKSTKTIQLYLEDMRNAGLIILYEANGDTFLNIPNFADKQPSLNPEREGKTTIPLPNPEQVQTNSGLSPPKFKVSKDKDNINKYMSVFDEARKLFPGTKRGLKYEFDNFCQKHKDWKNAIFLLKPAIQTQIDFRKNAKGFVPNWKNFKTWINQACWTEELVEGKNDKTKQESIQDKFDRIRTKT